MIQVSRLKKITSVLLILLTALLLFACGKKENIPYGSLGNETYLTVGDFKVTNKEVYDSLRKQGSKTLKDLINKELFKEFIQKANDLLAGSDEKAKLAQKDFDDLVNNALFQEKDVDKIKKMSDSGIDKALRKYVDGVYSGNPKILRDNLLNDIKDILNNKEDENFATKYYNIASLKEKYNIDIAKKLYAETIFRGTDKNGEAYDDKNDNYIKDTAVISHYEDKVKGRDDSNVFMFYFLTLNEANAALRSENLKIDGRGNWFKIPDIRDKNVMEDLYAKGEVTPYLEETLEAAGINGYAAKLAAKPADSKDVVNEGEYKDFYDAYSPLTDRDTQISTAKEVLEEMLRLYNIVNGAKKLDETYNNDGKIKYKDSGNEYKTNYTYDELDKLNSSLRSYVYDTLTEKKPYSNLRSISNFRYLVFKLDTTVNYIDLVDEKKDADGNKQWYTIDKLVEKYDVDKIKAAYPTAVDGNSVNKEKLTELINTEKEAWKEAVIIDRLTDSYVSTKTTDILKDLNVEIYDDLIRAFYNKDADEKQKAKGKGKKGDVVAKITGKFDGKDITIEIKVDDLYNELENLFGISAAFDLATDSLLLKKYETKHITKEVYKGFEEEFRTMIANFSSGQFESSGYPASLGRETFLLLLFGAKDNKEAIKKGYVLPKLREIFKKDIAEQSKLLSDNDEDFIYKKLHEYTLKQYDQDLGINVSHLLVYFDNDGDGNPDDPKEFFKNMSNDEVTTVKNAILQLYKDISHHVANKPRVATGFEEIAKEFQESARIPLLARFDADRDKWNKNDTNSMELEKYRALGINLKFENISSALTNTSNIPGGSAVMDDVFYKRALYLHELITKEIESAKAKDEKLVDDGLPYFDFGGGSLNHFTKHDILSIDYLNDKNGDNPGIMSSFGFHFILVNSIDKKVSAKYEAPDNYDKDGFDFEKDDYTISVDDKRYNAYNSEEKISLDQIKYTIIGKKQDAGILTPSGVQNALTKYFDPVNQKFEHNSFSSTIIFKLLHKEGITWSSNGDLANRQKSAFNNILAMNKNDFNDFLVGNSDHDALYKDWFKDFNLEFNA